jgi:hypothetical protein
MTTDSLHRDGRVSQPAKGSMFKGPFHLPRMLWMCWRLLEEGTARPPRATETPKDA